MSATTAVPPGSHAAQCARTGWVVVPGRELLEHACPLNICQQLGVLSSILEHICRGWPPQRNFCCYSTKSRFLVGVDLRSLLITHHSPAVNISGYHISSMHVAISTDALAGSDARMGWISPAPPSVSPVLLIAPSLLFRCVIPGTWYEIYAAFKNTLYVQHVEDVSVPAVKIQSTDYNVYLVEL